MENLIWVTIGVAIVVSLLAGFFGGAVVNLFGGNFWQGAPIIGGIALAFFAGAFFSNR